MLNGSLFLREVPALKTLELLHLVVVLLVAYAAVEPPRASAQEEKISFSKLVVVGDSLAAGVENCSLEALLANVEEIAACDPLDLTHPSACRTL